MHVLSPRRRGAGRYGFRGLHGCPPHKIRGIYEIRVEKTAAASRVVPPRGDSLSLFCVPLCHCEKIKPKRNYLAPFGLRYSAFDILRFQHPCHKTAARSAAAGPRAAALREADRCELNLFRKKVVANGVESRHCARVSMRVARPGDASGAFRRRATAGVETSLSRRVAGRA